MPDAMKIEGLGPVVDALNELPDELARRALKNTARAQAKVLKEAVLSEIARRGMYITGTLMNSVVIRTKYKRSGETLATVKVTALYASFLEFGTSRIEPIPFVRTAAERSREGVVNDTTEILQKRVRNQLRTLIKSKGGKP